MAMFDGIFQRYRNSNRNKTVQQGTALPEDTPSSPAAARFGEDALKKNPNLEVFNNA